MEKQVKDAFRNISRGGYTGSTRNEILPYMTFRQWKVGKLVHFEVASENNEQLFTDVFKDSFVKRSFDEWVLYADLVNLFEWSRFDGKVSFARWLVLVFPTVPIIPPVTPLIDLVEVKTSLELIINATRKVYQDVLLGDVREIYIESLTGVLASKISIHDFKNTLRHQLQGCGVFPALSDEVKLKVTNLMSLGSREFSFDELVSILKDHGVSLLEAQIRARYAVQQQDVIEGLIGTNIGEQITDNSNAIKIIDVIKQAYLEASNFDELWVNAIKKNSVITKHNDLILYRRAKFAAIQEFHKKRLDGITRCAERFFRETVDRYQVLTQ
jgi:hypothetical protein